MLPNRPKVCPPLLIAVCSLAGLLSAAAPAPAPNPSPDPKPERLTPLMRAANSGDREQVQALLRSGADPAARDPRGQTALILTAAWTSYDVLVGGEDERHAAIVGDLVAAGAALNAQDRDGRTALMHAVRWGHSHTAAALLSRGADVALRDRRGRTALTYAAPNGREDRLLVRPLLERGARPSLIDALLLGDLPLARSLAGSSDQRDYGPSGETGLMLAAGHGEPELVRRLLARGADVNARDDRGFSPLLFGLGGNPEPTQLGPRRWSETPSESKQFPIVEALLARGARPNVRSRRGDTVLSWAIELKLDRIVRLLLQRGADLNQLGADGDPPLTTAIRRPDYGIVRLLLAHGADPNRGDNYFGLPLVAAVTGKESDPMIIRALLQHKAKVNERKYDSTPLMAAAHAGTAESIRILLNAGARVNVLSHDHTTALMLAAGHNTPETVKALLAAGADVAQRDQNGETALYFAELRDKSENAALLRAAGAR